MQEQILEQEQKEKGASAIEIVPPKEAIKELLNTLKTMKSRKEELLFPIQDELTELEEKAKRICEEITVIMREANKDEVTIPAVTTDSAKATWKLMPKPRIIYDAKALNAITDSEIREAIDKCKKLTTQGEPTVKLEVY